MKVSISGIDGFIGSALTKALATSTGFELIDQPLFKHSLDDATRLKQDAADCDVIVHLAAKTFVPDSFTNPYLFYKNNIDTTLSILELCRVRNIKLIYLSSYVYGQPQYFPIDEMHPVADFNPYAQSKLLGEQLCVGYARYFNVHYSIVRPFNIYGKNQPAHFLVSKILSMATEGHIQLEDPRPKRDYVHIDDVADAIIRIMQHNEFNGNVFNVCSGQSVSIQEIVEAATTMQSHDVKVTYSNVQRPNEILDTIGDNQQAFKAFQWKPTHNVIQDILTNEIDN